MKIFLALFLAGFLGIFYLLGPEEIQRFSKNKAISASPGHTPGVADGIETINKKFDAYRLRVKYEVGGKEYRLTTTSTDMAGVQRYLTMPLDVVYDTRNPATATLKRYYDLRRKDETLSHALLPPVVLAMAGALPIAAIPALIIALFRRKKK